MRKTILTAAAMISAAIVLSSGIAAAARTVNAALTFRDITVTMDGAPLEIRDAYGNVTEPFIYNDTAYLPIRAIAEAVGLDVQWDGENNAIHFTHGAPEAVQQTASAQASENNSPISQVSTTQNSGIKIYSAYPLSPNSAGGVDVKIYWRNDTGKTIKYITFTVTPYNAVGDQVYSEIANKSVEKLRITGPALPFNKNYIINPNSYTGEERYEYTLYSFMYNGNPHFIYTVDDPYISVSNYSSGKLNTQKIYLKDVDYENVYRGSTWENVWYNRTVKTVRIENVKVEYMDGTSETIDNPQLIKQ